VAFGWGSSAVSGVVAVVGLRGDVSRTYYTKLAIGDTTTIRVPEGTAAVTLSRHARRRIRLGERGGGRTTTNGPGRH
jgi:hypothetical protein